MYINLYPYHHFQRGPMDPAGGPESKKPRWSPNSLTTNLKGNGNGHGVDPFANYGYGSGAAVNQASFPSGPVSASPFSNNQLYSIPSLRLNTGQLGNNLNSQMSPNPNSAPPAFTQSTQQQQQSPQLNGSSLNGSTYAGFGSYGMNSMLNMNMNLQNMSMLNGFPYSPQLSSFPQVS